MINQANDEGDQPNTCFCSTRVSVYHPPHKKGVTLQRATIGCFVATHGNPGAVEKFKKECNHTIKFYTNKLIGPICTIFPHTFNFHYHTVLL